MPRKILNYCEIQPLLAPWLLLFITSRHYYLPLNLETCSTSFLEDGFARADVVAGDVGWSIPHLH